MMSLAVWLPGPMFPLEGLYPWSYVPSGGGRVCLRGVCLQGVCLGAGTKKAFLVDSTSMFCVLSRDQRRSKL